MRESSESKLTRTLVNYKTLRNKTTKGALLWTRARLALRYDKAKDAVRKEQKMKEGDLFVRFEALLERKLSARLKELSTVESSPE